MKQKTNKETKYQVHIAFGFHVNCYHSYRGDTCDTLGFGGDIKTIRHILDVLDAMNEKGVPVKGTWDFENAYTLERILPEYAPDIITRVADRQKQNGDENILMGYNNGAMSAMTEEEFMTSVNWAIHNPMKSGLEDVFGECQRIIRPQEVMFTPSQAKLYHKAGIEAVCLYNSCIPFDAFRTIIPALSDEEAFNPLRYEYEDESITMIPMYTQADLLDAGSLRHLVNTLHEKQQSGEINHDVFLFVNIDADSFLWEPLPIPKLFRKLPGANGLEGLIEEIKGLSFIVFDAPGNYLHHHKTIGTISFGEDVADGNYSGYASWAEKPFNRLIWTRLERARMYANLYKKDSQSPSFFERILLISTTHFGLASPVLNISREEKALELSNKMVSLEECALLQKWELKSHNMKKNEVWIKNRNNASLINMQLSLDKGFCYDTEKLSIKGKGLLRYTVIATKYWEDASIRDIYVTARFEKIKKKYKVTFHVNKSTSAHQQTSCVEMVAKKKVFVVYDKEHNMLLVEKVSELPVLYDKEGRQIARWNSWINYGDKVYYFEKTSCEQLSISGDGRGISLRGEIHLPDEIEPGAFRFDIYSMNEETGFFVIAKVQYPYTKETTEIATKAYNFGRFCDLNWKGIAPMELNCSFHDDVTVEKRNFMDQISRYQLSDFWNANPKNEKIDSFNHQLTGGILSVYDYEKGIILAHARQVLGSMAHCPMRLRTIDGKRKVSLNPFGTYHGEQRNYPSRGNGCMADFYTTTMPQAKSLAPSYNGAFEMSAQWLSCVNKSLKTDGDADRRAFADGCVVYTTSGSVHRMKDDNIVLHEEKRIGVQKIKWAKLLPADINQKDVFRLVINYLKNIKFT